ncbi:MAG: hypothetical protein NVSMB9_18150 [Isosphaeraceae bacterium]
MRTRRRRRPPVLECLEDRLLLATFKVINTLDDANPGSLRWAINQVNSDPNDSITNPDLIKFTIPWNDPSHFYYKDDGTSGKVSLANVALVPTMAIDGKTPITTDAQLSDAQLVGVGNTIDKDWMHSWWTIQPKLRDGTADIFQRRVESQLPYLTKPVLLDGYSQPGAKENTAVVGDNAVLNVVLDGRGLGGVYTYQPVPTQPSGLWLETSYSTVRGLDFQGWASAGLQSNGPDAHHNVIAGNFFGTDVSGTLAQGNGFGVVLITGAHDDTIGARNSSDFAGRNLVSGQFRAGIGIGYDGGTDNNVVAGNLIGTDRTGASSLGGGFSLAGSGFGVIIGASVRSTQIGGVDAQANTIAFNPGSGIWSPENFQFGTGSPQGTRITGNSIYANGSLYGPVRGLDIDLGGNWLVGSTGDPLDLAFGPVRVNASGPKVGPNLFAPFPALTSATYSGANTKITGTLQKSFPNKEIKLEFFANRQANPSGYGGGEVLLGSFPVSTDSAGNLLSSPNPSVVITTDASGKRSFTVSLPKVDLSRPYLSATATDPSGNTSEFSHVIQVNQPPVTALWTTTEVSSSVNPSVYGQAVTFTATVTADSPSTATPTGSVQFLVDGAKLGSPIPLAGGSQVSVATASLSSGTHLVTAQFVNADGKFADSKGTLNQAVNPSVTSTQISAAPSPSVAGQVVTLNALVAATAPGSGTPTGDVTFYDGSVAIGTSPLNSSGVAVLNTSTLVVGVHYLRAISNGSGNFVTSTSLERFHRVLPVTPANLQKTVAPGAAVTLVTTSNTTVSTAVTAINGLTNPTPSSPITVILDLGGGTYKTDTHIAAAPGVTVKIVNGTLVGGSPALIVDSGIVLLDGVTALNATNAPTIVVNGGSLIVRHSTIEESTAYTQTAFYITGGTVDLGKSFDPGGNTFNVNGAGVFLVNLSPVPVSAVGDTFAIDHKPLDTKVLNDDFTIADRIIDAHVVRGLGLVTFVPDHVYVTAVSRDIQKGVNSIGAGGTVNVQKGGDYDDYNVGARLLTVDFQDGPKLQLADDSALAVGTTTLRVTGAPADGIDIALSRGDAIADVRVAVNAWPVGTFAPTGGLVVHGGGRGTHIKISDDITLPAVLLAGGPDAFLEGGGGTTVAVGGGGTNTYLKGGLGRNVLIAGRGGATLEGRGNDNLLIGGFTDVDAVESALVSLLAEWNESTDFTTRAGKVKIRLGTKVHANGAANNLIGGSGQNLVYVAPVDRSRLTGIKDGDVLVDLLA